MHLITMMQNLWISNLGELCLFIYEGSLKKEHISITSEKIIGQWYCEYLQIQFPLNECTKCIGLLIVSRTSVYFVENGKLLDSFF